MSLLNKGLFFRDLKGNLRKKHPKHTNPYARTSVKLFQENAEVKKTEELLRKNPFLNEIFKQENKKKNSSYQTNE